MCFQDSESDDIDLDAEKEELMLEGEDSDEDEDVLPSMRDGNFIVLECVNDCKYILIKLFL